MATHIRFRKRNGCPPQGKCQIVGYPYTSWIVLLIMVVIILSMPFILGQASGMIAGIIMIVIYSSIYLGMRFRNTPNKTHVLYKQLSSKKYQSR